MNGWIYTHCLNQKLALDHTIRNMIGYMYPQMREFRRTIKIIQERKPDLHSSSMLCIKITVGKLCQNQPAFLFEPPKGNHFFLVFFPSEPLSSTGSSPGDLLLLLLPETLLTVFAVVKDDCMLSLCFKSSSTCKKWSCCWWDLKHRKKKGRRQEVSKQPLPCALFHFSCRHRRPPKSNYFTFAMRWWDLW